MQILGQNLRLNAQTWIKYAKICKFPQNMQDIENEEGLISKGVF